LLEYIAAEKQNFFVIGGGTNVLFSDEGFKGIIIKLTGAFEDMYLHSGLAYCGAGVNMATAVQMLAENSYRGLEFMSGIPGSIGGAVYGNAGTKDRWISESVHEIEVMDYSGVVKTLPAENIVFYYRKSGLSRYIILSVKFKITKGEKSEIAKSISSVIAEKKASQPLMFPNVGCIFRNPQEGVSAGKLIDEAGMKGITEGGAKISEHHANFIVNAGNARSLDVLKLIEKVRATVKEKSGINLMPEIKVVPSGR